MNSRSPNDVLLTVTIYYPNKMRITAFMLHALFAFVLLFGACSLSQTESLQVTDEPTAVPDKTLPGKALPGKVLIVYLSRTNNTKALAEIIHKHVGGTLVALDLSTPYPANYQATVQQVARENETGFLPPLKTKIDSIQTYERVFVGFPTWGMQPRRRSDASAHEKLLASV